MATITTILAPIPGIFYRTPSPGLPAFRQEGDAVTPDDTIGLIEAMKIFTPVLAGESGRILKFRVAHEDPIMAGQPLCDLET